MQAKSIKSLRDLQLAISTIPIQLTIDTVLPEFGLCREEVLRVIENNGLPLTPTSLAMVVYHLMELSQHDEHDEVDHIVTNLQLKLQIKQRRTWHVIKLLRPIFDEPINIMRCALPARVQRALLGSEKMRPEIKTLKIDDLLYISLLVKSGDRQSGQVLYVATPPGKAVALVSCVQSNLLRACVKSIGFGSFQNVYLNGPNVSMLLHTYNTIYTNADHGASAS